MMSSHREAPEISKDPVADNTDVYAFVSPDRPDTVTLIANFIPFQAPSGGPNFYEFGDDVLYEIHIANAGHARADVSYQFRFTTKIINPDTFLYNTGPIRSITDTANWNRPQYYSVTRVERQDHDGDDDADDHHYRSTVLASGLTVPPVNVGVRSTPNYASTFTERRHPRARPRPPGVRWPAGRSVLRRHRQHLRPRHAAAVRGRPPDPVGGGGGRERPAGFQRAQHRDPGSDSRRGPARADPARRARRRFGDRGVGLGQSPQVQGVRRPARQVGQLRPVRAGLPAGQSAVQRGHRADGGKDQWNALAPYQDKRFAKYVLAPELQRLLPVLYPGVFPNLAAYTKPRNDLQAILLTGIPKGVVPGFQNNTGPVLSDLLRLNLAVPPSKNPNPIGLIAGDPAGFPNGRRLADNVVAIELRAVAGATIPLVDPSFTPDAAASVLTDGTSNTNSPYLTAFPYLGTPAGGYQSKPGVPAA